MTTNDVRHGDPETVHLNAPSLTLPVRWRAHALVSVLVVALFAIAGTGLALHLSNRSVARKEAARTQASLAATKDVAELFSYDFQSIAGVLDERSELVTGAFADEYKNLVRTQVQPAATKQRMTTRTDVVTISVVGGDTHSVRLLMFLNQTSAREKSTVPVLTGSRVQVTMKKVAGSWRVAGVDPV